MRTLTMNEVEWVSGGLGFEDTPPTPPENVTVTGRRPSSTPDNVTIISQDDFAMLGVRDINEFLFGPGYNVNFKAIEIADLTPEVRKAIDDALANSGSDVQTPPADKYKGIELTAPNGTRYFVGFTGDGGVGGRIIVPFY